MRLAGLMDTDWLPSLCKEFNQKHDAEIREGTKREMTPNLYAIDRAFVRATTSANASARDGIPREVLNAIPIPAVPDAACCFAQLLNPHGLEVRIGLK